MDNVTAEYLSRAETWLVITTLIYFLMNGAQIFETAVLVPKWTAAPPESFQLFQGKYAIDLKTFWIILHSIHEIPFLLTLGFSWKLPILTPLLILFGIHMAVRIWTLLYFAPRIIEFQRIGNAGEHPPGLQQQVTLWKNLNYLRVGLFIAVSLALIPLCMQLMQMK